MVEAFTNNTAFRREKNIRQLLQHLVSYQRILLSGFQVIEPVAHVAKEESQGKEQSARLIHPLCRVNRASFPSLPIPSLTSGMTASGRQGGERGRLGVLDDLGLAQVVDDYVQQAVRLAQILQFDDFIVGVRASPPLDAVLPNILREREKACLDSISQRQYFDCKHARDRKTPTKANKPLLLHFKTSWKTENSSTVQMKKLQLMVKL